MPKLAKAKAAVRSRIVEHVTVRAGDLVPHELNPRTHDESQRRVLQALYEEIGFARSLLGYKITCRDCLGTGKPEGTFGPDSVVPFRCEPCQGKGKRIKLIDGHLRRGMDPDMQVQVEVLDVSEDEARKLLLSIDPLATLAGYDQETLDQLGAMVKTENEQLAGLWRQAGRAQAAADQALDEAREKAGKEKPAPTSWTVVIECADEAHQRDVLRWAKEKCDSVRAVTR